MKIFNLIILIFIFLIIISCNNYIIEGQNDDNYNIISLFPGIFESPLVLFEISENDLSLGIGESNNENTQGNTNINNTDNTDKLSDINKQLDEISNTLEFHRNSGCQNFNTKIKNLNKKYLQNGEHLTDKDKYNEYIQNFKNINNECLDTKKCKLNNNGILKNEEHNSYDGTYKCQQDQFYNKISNNENNDINDKCNIRINNNKKDYEYGKLDDLNNFFPIIETSYSEYMKKNHNIDTFGKNIDHEKEYNVCLNGNTHSNLTNKYNELEKQRNELNSNINTNTNNQSNNSNKMNRIFKFEIG